MGYCSVQNEGNSVVMTVLCHVDIFLLHLWHPCLVVYLFTFTVFKIVTKFAYAIK